MAKLLENWGKAQKNVLWGWVVLAASSFFFIFLSLQLVSADWCVLQQGKLIVRFVVLLLTDTRIPCSTTHFLLKWARWQNLDAFHWVLCTIANWVWGGLSKSGSFLWKRAFLSNTIIKTCVSINCLTVQSVVRAEENVCPGETETKDDVWGCLAPNMKGLHGWLGVRRRRKPTFQRGQPHSCKKEQILTLADAGVWFVASHLLLGFGFLPAGPSTGLGRQIVWCVHSVLFQVFK